VDDAVPVRFGQRREHLSDDVDRGLGVHAPGLAQVRLEVGPLDELHREVEDARLGVVEVEDLDRVRVGELARRDALALEAPQRLVRDLQVRPEDLERDPLA